MVQMTNQGTLRSSSVPKVTQQELPGQGKREPSLGKERIHGCDILVWVLPKPVFISWYYLRVLL